jgi:repressor LexA
VSRPPISGRGIATLDYIEAFTKEHGFPPTVREIGEGTGISSPSTVQGYLDALADAGYIERNRPGSPRAIKVLRHSNGTTVEPARPGA